MDTILLFQRTGSSSFYEKASRTNSTFFYYDCRILSEGPKDPPLNAKRLFDTTRSCSDRPKRSIIHPKKIPSASAINVRTDFTYCLGDSLTSWRHASTNQKVTRHFVFRASHFGFLNANQNVGDRHVAKKGFLFFDGSAARLFVGRLRRPRRFYMGRIWLSTTA